jgi:hypothetical protein
MTCTRCETVKKFIRPDHRVAGTTPSGRCLRMNVASLVDIAGSRKTPLPDHGHRGSGRAVIDGGERWKQRVAGLPAALWLSCRPVKVATRDQVPEGTFRLVEVVERRLLVVNSNGAFYAMDSRCWTIGGRLSNPVASLLVRRTYGGKSLSPQSLSGRPARTRARDRARSLKIRFGLRETRSL